MMVLLIQIVVKLNTMELLLHTIMNVEKIVYVKLNQRKEFAELMEILIQTHVKLTVDKLDGLMMEIQYMDHMDLQMELVVL